MPCPGEVPPHPIGTATRHRPAPTAEFLYLHSASPPKLTRPHTVSRHPPVYVSTSTTVHAHSACPRREGVRARRSPFRLLRLPEAPRTRPVARATTTQPTPRKVVYPSRLGGRRTELHQPPHRIRGRAHPPTHRVAHTRERALGKTIGSKRSEHGRRGVSESA